MNKNLLKCLLGLFTIAILISGGCIYFQKKSLRQLNNINSDLLNEEDDLQSQSELQSKRFKQKQDEILYGEYESGNRELAIKELLSDKTDWQIIDKQNINNKKLGELRTKIVNVSGIYRNVYLILSLSILLFISTVSIHYLALYIKRRARISKLTLEKLQLENELLKLEIGHKRNKS